MFWVMSLLRMVGSTVLLSPDIIMSPQQVFETKMLYTQTHRHELCGTVPSSSQNLFWVHALLCFVTGHSPIFRVTSLITLGHPWQAQAGHFIMMVADALVPNRHQVISNNHDCNIMSATLCDMPIASQPLNTFPQGREDCNPLVSCHIVGFVLSGW